MGTCEQTLELQRVIKKIISELGWSQNDLARKLYTELNEIDDEAEIKYFQERFKKELQRKTTKPELLSKYLSIILMHPDAESIDLVLNRYVPTGAISPSMCDKMEKISKEIDFKCNEPAQRNKMVEVGEF